MALGDHLRELRARVLRSILVLTLAFVVLLFCYEQLLDFVMDPYNQARVALGHSVQTKAYVKGVGGPLMLQLKLCGVAAIIATSPYWLYQIWAFIVPGLHPHERKWTRIFVAIAGPLFVLGVVVGYLVLPKGLEVLLGFTTTNLESLVEFTEYFSFFTRMLLVFGISFEIPLFVVLLNLIGVLPAKRIAEYRSWIILGIFIFAAVATPSTDPFSMLFLGVPMVILFLIAEVVARITDKRRRERATAQPAVADDEATPYDQL
ncbi:MAG: twin-arginine translocase subunit TatC [Nocardioidaceae bacterium]